MELPPQYNPKDVEDKIYRMWEKSGFFDPDKLPKHRPASAKTTVGKAFTIIMPPPNASGALHIGNAVFVTLEDIMIRFQRMRGRKTLWLPGTDHAGIETEYTYRKKIEKEGRRWNEIPREQLYRDIYEFTQNNKVVVENQLRKLGASCDWSREKFTLDPDIVAEVQKTFVQMYDDGLIYHGSRIVNWSVKDQTALSDLEIEYREQNDPLYYIKYGPLELATVRPETKFGDTAVAVHPRDKRYSQYVGKEIGIETLLGPAKIKVIADEAVDPDFGTGVVKVTPAHDPADFEIGLRHGLEVRQVIDRYGKLNEKTGPYAGLKVEEARRRIVEDMRAKGLITKVEESYTHSVAYAKRSGGIIEPMVMPQWFVKTASLRDAAVKAVRSGKIKFIPERYKKVFFHWMKNLRDWNISRQIIWGIRTPVWYCRGKYPDGAKKIEFAGPIVPQVFSNKTRTYRLRDYGFSEGEKVFFEKSADGTILGYGVITGVKKTTVGDIELPDLKNGRNYEKTEELIVALKRHYPEKVVTKETQAWIYDFAFHLDPAFGGCGKTIVQTKTPARCPHCGSASLIQDPDVLDTWFSSGQWPLLSLGFPNSRDYKTFYPTDVMETGWDILFFWVARMIMLGLYRTGKIPFRTVYLHGLVRDKDRQKMSKSKGNVIDPLGVAELYGTDAVRMALTVGNLPGNDIIISEEKIKGYRNFANKIWNASRFLMLHVRIPPDTKKVKFGAQEKAMRLKLQKAVREVTRDLEAYKFHHAADKLYHFFWHYYADKVIEQMKPKLDLAAGTVERETAKALLLEFHANLLKLLHPFMPFITEEIWSHLPIKDKKLLMVEKWPV